MKFPTAKETLKETYEQLKRALKEYDLLEEEDDERE